MGSSPWPRARRWKKAKVIAFMGREEKRTMWDFEDIGDWWTRADPREFLRCRRATHRGHGARGGRAGVSPRGTPHQEGDLPSPDDDQGDDLRSGADRRMPPMITAGTGMDEMASLHGGLCRAVIHPLAEASRWRAGDGQGKHAQGDRNGRRYSSASTHMTVGGCHGAPPHSRGARDTYHLAVHPVGSL